jgi:hypothetical protein
MKSCLDKKGMRAWAPRSEQLHEAGIVAAVSVALVHLGVTQVRGTSMTVRDIR